MPLDVDMRLALLKAMATDKNKADTSSTAAVLTIPQTYTVPADSLKYPPLRIKAGLDSVGERSFTFLNLTPDDAKKLNQASFSAVALTMNTPGGGTVAKEFKKTDKLTILLKASIVFFISEDKLKN
jgi:hypothetical protein